MSGAYVVQNGGGADSLRDTAQLLSAQLSWGEEKVNHFALSGSTLLGLVSPDPLKNGVMPKYLREHGVWGLILGGLYDSDFLTAWERDNDEMSHLAIFVRLWKEGRLEQAAPQLNGAFFVILWDPSTRTLLAINDRFGLYPMYWSFNKGEFVLASRVLCSVLAGLVPGTWDEAGVAQMLTTNDSTGNITLIRDVEAYPQATIMQRQGAGPPQWKTYWRYDFSPQAAPMNETEIARELGRLFLRSVERQSHGVDRVGVTLSGGLDSRTIVAAAAKQGIPVHTFTWGKEGSYDRAFASKIAKTYGTTHHDCDYEYMRYEEQYDEVGRVVEGLTNGLDIHMLAHLHILQESAHVVLNGFAGDVIAGGSFLRAAWMDETPAHKLDKLLLAWRTVLLQENNLGQAMTNVSALESHRKPSALYGRLLSEMEGLSTPDKVDRFFLENRQRRTTAIGTVLMRCGVESAACFFDYDFIDLMSSVPAPLRREHRIYMKMLRETLPESLSLPYQRTLLPAGAPLWAAVGAKAFLKGCKILERRVGWPTIASRLSPVDFPRWLRGPLKSWMGTVCNEAHPVADEVLRRDYCEKTWEEHCNGVDRTLALGTIASLRAFSLALAKARAKEPASSRRPEEVSDVSAAS